MFNNKHDTIQELRSILKFRNSSIDDLKARLLWHGESQLIVSALRHVAQLVRDKADATKIPNGKALTDAQELFRLADSLARACTSVVSAINYDTYSQFLLDPGTDPIAAVLGGSAE